MVVHIAFLRAVNVAPRWVKMEQLRKLLSDNGFDDVETHIQSGNIRLRTAMRSRAKIVATLERLIEEAKISNARIEKLVGPATTRDLKVVRALAAKWGDPA